ncbi:MAG: DUF4238 domain-containing protein [Pseudomonadota bacterium]|nr:DUF4238 domain-containing protein [Pseudomonadota bacterium]
MSSRSKRHHFVPKVLQKAFCADGDRIWYAARDATGRYSRPELRNTEKTFWERNLYTVLEDGLPSDIIEKRYFGTLDDYLGKIIPDITKHFANREAPLLTGDDLNGFREAMFVMATRTPDFISSDDDLVTGRELVQGVLSETQGNPELENTPELRKLTRELTDDAILRAYGRNIRVRALVKPNPKIIATLKEFSLRWSIAPERHSYILSSLIAYRIGNGGSNGLGSPSMEMWMPISPKIAAVLVRDPENKIPLAVRDQRDHVREINEFAARKSRQIASDSEKLLTSLCNAAPIAPDSDKP